MIYHCSIPDQKLVAHSSSEARPWCRFKDHIHPKVAEDFGWALQRVVFRCEAHIPFWRLRETRIGIWSASCCLALNLSLGTVVIPARYLLKPVDTLLMMELLLARKLRQLWELLLELRFCPSPRLNFGADPFQRDSRGSSLPHKVLRIAQLQFRLDFAPCTSKKVDEFSRNPHPKFFSNPNRPHPIPSDPIGFCQAKQSSTFWAVRWWKRRCS